MKKRTKIFLICCGFLAVALLAVAIYFKSTLLSGIAGALIAVCVTRVVDKYCN